MNEILQARALPSKPTKRYFQAAPCRVYSAREICEFFGIARRTFFDWKRQQKLPLFEVRVGRTVRYQAGPIDRVLMSGARHRG
jgi:hypothetical protein